MEDYEVLNLEEDILSSSDDESLSPLEQYQMKKLLKEWRCKSLFDIFLGKYCF